MSDPQNNDNETALHCAAQYGHTEVVKVLLEELTDPTMRNNKFETPLDLAALYGRLEVVKMLLNAHPNLLSCNTKKHTPLHLAARNGHKAVVHVLLDAGMDSNYQVPCREGRRTPRSRHGELRPTLLPRDPLRKSNSFAASGLPGQLSVAPRSRSEGLGCCACLTPACELGREPRACCEGGKALLPELFCPANHQLLIATEANCFSSYQATCEYAVFTARAWTWRSCLSCQDTTSC